MKKAGVSIRYLSGIKISAKIRKNHMFNESQSGQRPLTPKRAAPQPFQIKVLIPIWFHWMPSKHGHAYLIWKRHTPHILNNRILWHFLWKLSTMIIHQHPAHMGSRIRIASSRANMPKSCQPKRCNALGESISHLMSVSPKVEMPPRGNAAKP